MSTSMAWAVKFIFCATMISNTWQQASDSPLQLDKMTEHEKQLPVSCVFNSQVNGCESC